jgi:hypothetical protein
MFGIARPASAAAPKPFTTSRLFAILNPPFRFFDFG